MTRRRRRVIPLIVGLAVICVGLAAHAVTFGERSGGEGDQRRLDISSIDLTIDMPDAILSARDMVPGDTITAAVTIANPDRRPMTYAMRRGVVSAGGAALSAALVLMIKTIGSSCADFDGATIYDGPLDRATFGGDGPGRPLAAATAEILCFRATLPRDVDNVLQGAATTVTLSFGSDWPAAVR